MSHILLVDADLEFRESLANQLRAYGFEVSEASSAPQALDAIARLMPAVVVVDVDLPTISGIEFLRHMRSRGRFLRIRAMILTSNASKRHVLEAGRLKIPAYLSKLDFRFADFLSRLVAVAPDPPPAQILFPALRKHGLCDNSVGSASGDVSDSPVPLPRIGWKSFLQRLSARALKPEALRILHQCCSQEVTLGDLEESVKASPLLAARVLSTANSAAFHPGGKKVVRLSDAIGLIGQDQLRNLVSSSFVEDHFLSELQEETSWRAWQFGLACGNVMETLRGPELKEIEGAEYLLGLGLSLPTLVFAQNLKEEIGAIKEWHERHRAYDIDLFETLFGIPADEACHAMLERVGIPELIVQPISSYVGHLARRPEAEMDLPHLALDLSTHFASAMFFPISPFFPLRPLPNADLARLPTIARLSEQWRRIRQEVLVRSFEIARDSEVVREIVARPYFTRRDDVRVEIRTDAWAAPFGPIRLFLTGICDLVEVPPDAPPAVDCALVLVSDDPRTLLRPGDEKRSTLVLHHSRADFARIRQVERAGTLALPCSMASLTQAIHGL